MNKINGIIKDGRVYVTDPECVDCRVKCALFGYCNEIYAENYHGLCVILSANANEDFGYRYSDELTERLKGGKV